jgi:hypothetical protein
VIELQSQLRLDSAVTIETIFRENGPNFVFEKANRFRVKGRRFCRFFRSSARAGKEPGCADSSEAKSGEKWSFCVCAYHSCGRLRSYAARLLQSTPLRGMNAAKNCLAFCQELSATSSESGFFQAWTRSRRSLMSNGFVTTSSIPDSRHRCFPSSNAIPVIVRMRVVAFG